MSALLPCRKQFVAVFHGASLGPTVLKKPKATSPPRLAVCFSKLGSGKREFAMSASADSRGSEARKRRFAPLRQENEIEDGPRLKGVVFDVDGTLCEPQNYMFGEMRQALGIPKSVDILDHIYSLPEGEQEESMEKIRNIERTAMRAQKPQPGLQKLMDYLDSKGIRKGICTRNFDAPVEHLLTTFLPSHTFGPIITRAFRPPKPDPAGILHIATQWAEADGWELPGPNSPQADISIPKSLPGEDSVVVDEAQSEKKHGEDDRFVTSAALREDAKTAKKGREIDLIMVGDSIDDMTAGYRAGAATVLLVNDANRHLVEHEHTDLVVSRLDELIEVLENGFESHK